MAMKKKISCPVPKVVKKSKADELKEHYVLRLFMAGATTRSLQAVLRVREFCEAELLGCHSLEIIDIYQQPELVRANQIVATPTLIKDSPGPVCRFIGTLAIITGLTVELDFVRNSKIIP